nr:hypothetical protein [Tanacetum cinerariifolium]
DELSDKELKQIEADDQAIQTILLGLPEDIYAAVDNCETAQEIWLRVQQMMKGSDIGIQEKKAKLFNKLERFTSNEGESIESYYHRWSRHVTIVHQTKDLHTADYTQLYDFLKYNQKENYLQQPMTNPEYITDPTTAMNMALALMAKAFKLNYSTPTNNNQRISSNPRNRQIAQLGQNAGISAGYNDVIGNQNQIGNGNLVAARAEGNAAGQNGNQIRCYNCRGVADLDEIEEVNANCILMANLQQASTSGTQTDSTPVYDTDGSAEEAAKFVGDFTSLANKADASLAKHKALELEIERLLKAVVSQDIMVIVQNESVVHTSDLQTELERTKERFENCIIKKEIEYAKLWNDWYKKCDECKYDKISYDKAYKDMRQKIKRLQAQLRYLKGK